MNAVDPTDFLDELEAGELALEFEDQGPSEILTWGLRRFPRSLALVTSFQIEGMVLLDLAIQIDPDVRVLTVDPGKLPAETLEFIDKVRHRYGVRVEVFRPREEEVRGMVQNYGENLFYHDVSSRLLCCHVRKVRPLTRGLRGLNAWVTGLRRDQWASRANVLKLEIDHDHDGIAKLNPLADWTNEDVESYARKHDVPRHPLYEKGYTSLGCAPCTRPVRPGEPLRAGRWWWEKNAPKECGIHCALETGNLEREVEHLLEESPRDLSDQTTRQQPTEAS